MNLFVVRHGITDWNLQGKAQGIEDIPLNEGGILQANACGEQLKGLPVAHMVSGPLSRARRTAEIIGAYLGIAEIHIMEEFTERDFGKLSGATQEEMRRLRGHGKDLGMESREATSIRTMRGLERLEQQYGDSNVMLVTHGGLIRNMLRKCMEEQEIPEFFENCGICMLTYRAGELSALAVNLLPGEFMSWFGQRGQ